MSLSEKAEISVKLLSELHLGGGNKHKIILISVSPFTNVVSHHFDIPYRRKTCRRNCWLA
jgi:hypothetical protein